MSTQCIITCWCSEVCGDIPLGSAALVVYPTKSPPQQVGYQAYTPCGHGLYYIISNIDVRKGHHHFLWMITHYV